MKIRYALTTLFILAGVFIIGCKEDPPPPPTAAELQIEKLSKTWVKASTANAITVEGVDVSTDWDGFTLTVTEGAYTTSSAYSAEVWPSNGTWDFLSETEVNTIVRDNVTNVKISVTDDTLIMEFEYSSSGGRVSGIEGTWIFNMVAQ